ncbi:hypothetical protein KY495_19320 [Massilia sp. PAMC28688]|uniref:PEP-CTERM sorting domain-containing protein n=1 Tax=Massilia sp. PAMC28688 TaxID=2861283 RepID=UPI001C633655|nr:PEP-CTERM sorting domain-containing protein [Massilia sp. PAMC28688]QYF92844.1 hypothetical protein KY495_19320 [Massilia sp. PAMC28688]
MKNYISAIFAAGSLIVASQAWASPTLTTFGSSAQTGVFDCAWNAARTACNLVSNDDYNGTTVHRPTGVLSQSSDARGSAWASAEISTTSYLPSLHAYAYSNPAATGPSNTNYGGSSWADANVWGVQGYTYTGDTPFLLTLTATLDSVFSRPNVDRQGNHSTFQVSIFDTSGYSFGYSDNGLAGEELCPILFAGPVRGRCLNMPAVFARGSETLYDTGMVSTTVNYLLTPGQSFFVGAFLDASVCCGATVDSSHSLNMLFNDATLLRSFAVPGAVVAVPEPASLPAALLALGILAGMRRQTWRKAAA